MEPAPGVRAMSLPFDRLPSDLRQLRERIPSDVRRGAPYALVLALVLGFAVVLGAHLSHAWPSRDRPFGLPGPSSFEYAVAMVRPDLVLATTLPAVLLGARALESRSPTRDGALRVMGVAGMHAILLVLAVLAAAGIGVWGAKRTPGEAFVAFTVAHSLLALAFYTIGFVWAASLQRHAVAAALTTWAALVMFYDSFVKLRVLREVGLPGLEAGTLPEWFYAAQAFSPLTVYRGVLILWRDNFRDAVERAMLDGAALPAWMNSATFSAVMIVMWVALPLAIALGIWKARSWHGQRTAPARGAAKAPLLR